MVQAQTHEPSTAESVTETEPKEAREFLRYALFKVSNEWKRLPDKERAASKREFAAAVREISAELNVKTYSMTGIRGDADFMLWIRSDTLDGLHALGAKLNATHMGRFSDVPYSFLALTRPSPYVPRGRRPEEAGFEAAKYLFVYPFVKTREWYKLPQQWRTAMMKEHIAIGRKYPNVRINTGYSYGLDDQEHVVSFESDSATDFLDLVMDLRESEQSSYTFRDTPAFSCVLADIDAALNAVAG